MNDTTGEYKDGGYIVYSAKDNEMLPLSDFTYTLGDIFYRFTQGEKCDTTVINEDIQPSGSDYEIHTKCNSNEK